MVFTTLTPAFAATLSLALLLPRLVSGSDGCLTAVANAPGHDYTVEIGCFTIRPTTQIYLQRVRVDYASSCTINTAVFMDHLLPWVNGGTYGPAMGDINLAAKPSCGSSVWHELSSPITVPANDLLSLCFNAGSNLLFDQLSGSTYGTTVDTDGVIAFGLGFAYNDAGGWAKQANGLPRNVAVGYDVNAAYSIAPAVFPRTEESGSTTVGVVTRDCCGEQPVTFTCGYQSGTAGAGKFSAITGATFASGSCTATCSITIIDNAISELAKTAKLRIAHSSGYGTVSSPSNEVTVDISASDPLTVKFSLSAVSVAEGSGSVTLQLVRTGGSGEFDATVTFGVGGTAPAAATGGGVDYASADKVVTFLSSENSKTFTVAINDDTLGENSESFLATISSISRYASGVGNGNIGSPSTCGVTITDDDPINVNFASGTYPVAEGNAVVVTASRSGGGGAFSISASPSGGSAVSTDYSGAGTLSFSFAAGATSATSSVTASDDLFPEGPETIVYNFALPASALDVGNFVVGGSVASTTVTIAASDAYVIGFGSSSYSGTESAGTVSLNLERSPSSVQESCDVTVTFSPVSATGGGTDFASTTQVVSFLATDTTKWFSVTINNDVLPEASETFTATIASVTNDASGMGTPGGTTTTTVTILDNDAYTIGFSSASYAGTESAGSVTLQLVRSPSSVQESCDVTVTFSPGSATGGGTDFTSSTQVVSLLAADGSKTLVVPINDDVLSEASETFTATIATVTNDASGKGTAGGTTTTTVTIAASDAINVSFNSTAVNVREEDLSASLVVERTGSGVLSVDVSLAPGTATAPGDYSAGAFPMTLSFGAAEISKVVVVPIVDDGVGFEEGVETFTASLSNVVFGGPTTVGGDATVTILAQPRVDSIEGEGSTDGTSTVTVHGGFFVDSGGGEVVSVGGTAAVSTTVVSDSMIDITVPEGEGLALDVVVTILDVSSAPGNGLFSYSGPRVTAVSPDPAPKSPHVLTVHGSNFGLAAADSSDVRLTGGVFGAPDLHCTAVPDTVSHTMITCPIAAGAGGERSVSVNVDGVNGTLSANFSYLPVTVTAVDPPRVARVTIRGANFGPLASWNDVHVGYGAARRRCVPVAVDPASLAWLACDLVGGSAGLGTELPFDVTVGPIPSSVTLPLGFNVTTLADEFEHAQFNLTLSTTAPLAPDPPAASAAPFASTGAVALSWPVPDLSISGWVPVTLYTVLRDGIAIGTTAAVTFDDSTAAELTTYSYALAINTTVGGSGPSAAVTVTTSYRGPVLAVIDPSVVPTAGGTPLTLRGAFFGANTAEYVGTTVGGYNATLISWVSSTEVVVSTPPNSIGATSVTISTVHGADTVTDLLVYPPAPNVTAVAPLAAERMSGPAGTTVVGVSGHNLGMSTADVALLSLAGVPCLAVSWRNDSHVDCTPGVGPATGGSGPVAFATSSGGSADLFGTFTYSAPAIAAVAMSAAAAGSTGSVAAGQVVVINGVAFGSAATDLISVHVTSTDVPATAGAGAGRVPCAAAEWRSEFEVRCTLPTGLSPGSTYGFIVTTVSGGETAPSTGPERTVIVAPAAGVPSPAPSPVPMTVTAVSPSGGPAAGGQVVTVLGSGFEAEVNITRVTLAGVPCAPVERRSPTELGCVSGARAQETSVPPSGPVVVTSAAGANASGGTYTYVVVPVEDATGEPLIVNSVAPEVHPLAGNIEVTLEGQGFAIPDGSIVRVEVYLAGADAARTESGDGDGGDGDVDGDASGGDAGSTSELLLAAAQNVPGVRTAAGDAGGIVHFCPVRRDSDTGTAYITFLSPRVDSSAQDTYASLAVHALDPFTNQSIATVEVSRALYFTDFCSRPGVYGVDVDCRDCPEGGICPGGNRIIPMPGYWNPGEASGFVQECVPREACLGGPGAPCAPEYEGFVCGSCRDGYTKITAGVCDKCPAQEAVLIYVLCDIFLWLSVSCLGWFVKDGENFQRGVEFVDVLQSAAIFSSLLSPETPLFILKIYDALKIFLGDYTVLKTDCLGTLPAYEVEFFTSVVHNLLILIVMAGGTWVIGFVRRATANGTDRKRDMGEFYADRLVRVAMVWINLSYINLTEVAFQALYCRRIGERLVLDVSRNTTCFAGGHVPVFAVAVIIVLLMTIGWPIIYTLRVRSMILKGRRSVSTVTMRIPDSFDEDEAGSESGPDTDASSGKELHESRSHDQLWRLGRERNRRDAAMDETDVVRPSESSPGARFDHRWGMHYILLKPSHKYFYLFSYASMFAVAFALVFLAEEPIPRATFAGGVIIAHIACLCFLKPHTTRLDDFVELSFEFPLLLLLGINAAVELNRIEGTALKRASLATLAIITTCILINFVDAVYNVAFKKTKAIRSEDGPDSKARKAGDSNVSIYMGGHDNSDIFGEDTAEDNIESPPASPLSNPAAYATGVVRSFSQIFSNLFSANEEQGDDAMQDEELGSPSVGSDDSGSLEESPDIADD